MKKTRMITIAVPTIRLNEGEALGITGSCEALGEWKKAVIMDGTPYAKVRIEEAAGSFEYKFVIADRKSGDILAWEEGWNRSLDCKDDKGDTRNGRKTSDGIRVTATPARLPRQAWKGAGTAIPVFSLRSEEDFGVGEFHDLKKMVDWAALTGQSIIQLLPINDTTMTGTWEDSYPYNANSTFALHPQFIHLPDIGVEEDEDYKTLQKELNSLPEVNYEKVNNEKHRLMQKAFAENGRKVAARKSYKEFMAANSHWLIPYAAFRTLTARYGTPDFSRWGEYSKYNEETIAGLCMKQKKEMDFHCFVQYHLHMQMTEVRKYAHSKGVMLKGDLPIGISRTSVDAWLYPSLFHMDSQAGAPPDAFAADGQNWGFPTYNWERMAKDGFKWWKERLQKMSEYFDAFRIDHILGFFRIWEIPVEYRSGIMGHFNPALPYSEDELLDLGFDAAAGQYFISPDGDCTNVLFVKDPKRKGYWHPRIAAQDTEAYKSLGQNLKDTFNRLYDDFFYRRHNRFWKESAYLKLPYLLGATDMLACGEDLGMIPACVPDTMKELQILSLEIQRMPKAYGVTFDNPATYPYLSVCTTSTHDMNPIRAWWEEEKEMTEKYFKEILGEKGETPASCEPWICRNIIEQHLASPAMFTILPLQDWLSMDGSLRLADPHKERINIPAISRHQWRYRMHLTLGNLLGQTEFNGMVTGMVKRHGR